MEINLEKILDEGQIVYSMDHEPMTYENKNYQDQICKHLQNKELVAFLLAI